MNVNDPVVLACLLAARRAELERAAMASHYPSVTKRSTVRALFTAIGRRMRQAPRPAEPELTGPPGTSVQPVGSPDRVVVPAVPVEQDHEERQLVSVGG